MILNLYCVRDKVANKSLCVFTSTNDGMAIRENMVALSRVAPLGDLELNRIGTFDDENMNVAQTPSVIVSWDTYKFPESPVKDIVKDKTK